jgi:glycine betaine catabolism B
MVFVEAILNRTNMYRLTLYGLTGLVLVASLLSFFGVLAHNPWHILIAPVFLIGVCFGTNIIFARIFQTKANPESAPITGLILALIVGPVALAENLLLLSLVGVAAMASKYLIAWRGKHIFNPAAFGVLAAAFLLQQGASWWVSNIYLAPAVLLVGFLLTKKIGRGSMIILFLSAYAALTLLLNAAAFSSPEVAMRFLWTIFVYSPLLFFAFIMLPEPQTSPKHQTHKLLYGAFVALVLVLFQKYLPIPYTLELALLGGNAFAFAISHPFRIKASLVQEKEIASHIMAFCFSTPHKLQFAPGQYLEWTLHHPRPDSRGIRRYFTIASSPTENGILLACKIPEKPSTFKQTLLRLKKGENAIATGIEGDFTLPADPAKKLVFIAGGIGITPFRSMAKYLIDKEESRDIVLLYAANTKEEFAFEDVFSQAKNRGLRPVYIPGKIYEHTFKEHVPDWQERLFYVSGPQPMVQAMQKTLSALGVKRTRIKHDYFPGYEEI